MPGILEPTESFNLRLSNDLKGKLKAVGYDLETFDQLVEEMIKLLQMKSQVKALGDRLDNLSAADLKSMASAYGLKSGSVEASKLGTRKTTLTRTGDKLMYDFNEIIKGVPSDMSVVGATTTVTGANGGGRHIDGGNAGVVTIPSSGSSVKLEVNIQTKKGIITLNNTVLVPEEDGTSEVTLGVSDYTSSISDMYVSEHFELLSAEVAALKQKISG